MAALLRAIIRHLGKNLVFGGLLVANVLVFQQGDTLKFLKENEVIDQWLLSGNPKDLPDNNVVYIKKAKVSTDSNYFFIYEEEYHRLTDSIFTKISLYNAAQEKLWEKSADKGRKISFCLTRICKDSLILVTTNNDNTKPSLEIIANGKKTPIIKDNQWHRIITYTISPNMQYLLLHVKNFYNKKKWDYIYFIDMHSHDNWTYIFPICVSCKRKKIELTVYDDGKSDVMYKGEHRVFSKQGKLIDIYIE